MSTHPLTLLLTLALAPQAPAPSQAEPPAAPPAAAPASVPARVVQPSAGRTNAGLDKAISDLCAAHPTRVFARTLGKSATGTPITALMLTTDPAKADTRPGVLVVAGLDGPRWSGTEAALVLAESLALKHGTLLDAVTVFVVPRANPDASSSFLATPRRDYSGNGVNHDNDRDRRTSENPPQDLNGDGYITVMRARDLGAPYANPTLVADAAEPRLLRAPDPLKGEVAQYTVFVEGIDIDGDGRISEDSPGGIVPDRNFPHRWPEFEDEAGAFPLSAPEANALVQFVIKHPSLVGAFVIGRLDTVVNPPDGKAKAEGGTPAMIAEDDAKAYAQVAQAYRELVGQTRATESDSAGSFAAWMNAQRGVPTFAAQLWGKPDAPAKAPEAGKTPDATKADAPKSGAPAATPTAPAAAPPADTPAAVPGGPPSGRPGRGGRGRPQGASPPPAPTAGEKVQAASPDDAAWLALSDAQGGAGFVAWTQITHPQLGSVEIGGWVPGWRENIPLEQLEAIGDKCAAFVASLADHRARIELSEPRVTMLGPGLYRIETTLSNIGKLPTIQQGGRSGDVTPAHVVRVSPPVDRVKSGQRMAVVRGMTPGETRRMQWIVSAAPDEIVQLELLFAGSPTSAYEIRNGEVIK